MVDKSLFGSAGWTPARLKSQQGKTFVITGANSGVGFQASRLLLSQGAQVIMLNRSAERSKVAVDTLKREFGATADVDFITMDLGDFASINKAANALLSKVSRIDALICNGAIAQVAKQTFTVDGFESQFGVNHLGHFLLSGLLFKRINESHGRIVVVASEGHKLGIKRIKFEDINWDRNYHPNKAYSQSKLAQMMFAYELQNKIKIHHQQVKVYVCHPGASNTSLIRENANPLTRFTWSLMVKMGMAQSAEKGAYPEVMCATEEPLAERAYYGPTGMMNFGGPVGECKLAAFVLEQTALEQLWNFSEQATSFTWKFD